MKEKLFESCTHANKTQMGWWAESQSQRACIFRGRIAIGAYVMGNVPGKLTVSHSFPFYLLLLPPPT